MSLVAKRVAAEPSRLEHEPRWPVALAVLTVLLLLAAVPARIRVFPPWVPYLGAVAITAPMLALSFATNKARWLRIEGAVTLLVLALAGFGILDSLEHILAAMVHGSIEITGLQLLDSSIAVWATNVLVFSIIYWRTDRGGPEARSNHAIGTADWLFPQESAAHAVKPGWHPTFIDYLFLSFCTATAFSPAEAQPVSPRGMLLLMLESLISLVTVIAIAARAINILGG